MKPETVYYGKREDVIREVGGLTHIYPGKYLVQLDGAGTYDAEGAESIKDMKGFVDYFCQMFPGIRVVKL